MKKMKWILGVVAAALIIGMTGCGVIAAALAAPYGYVFDGRTGDPISGVTVTMTNLSTNTSVTATTGSTGQYNFSTVDYGQFELTASHSDYFFTKQIVEVSGLNQELSQIGGFSTDLNGDTVADITSTSGAVTIAVFWDTDFQDVNSYLTFPNATENITFASTDFYNPTTASYSAEMLPITTLNRVRIPNSIDGEVYDGTTKDFTGTGGSVWLEMDNVGYVTQPAGGPETMTISFLPTTIGYTAAMWNGTDESYTVSSLPDPSGITELGTYTCIGVMEYYIDAWSNTEPTSASGFGSAEDGVKLSATDNLDTANPTVYVFSDLEQIAQYTLPKYTDIERASVFRINVFMNNSDDLFYQFIPDIKVLDNDGNLTNIKSAASDSVPVVVKGARR